MPQLYEGALKKARWKILPLLVLMYALSILDRTNVGFVKSQLDIHLGIDASAFAFGVGIFFIGYSIFQIPSNLALQRVGAKKWLSLLMILWGVVTFLMIYMKSPTSFYFLRFLLGVIEAGFYPGIILYLSYWFPGNTRSQAIALVQLGAPIALIFGAPLTGWILELPSIASLADWQLVFAVQGLITIFVAAIAYIWLVDEPKLSKWLSDAEKENLAAAIEHDNTLYKEEDSTASIWVMLKDLNIWRLVAIYFTIQVNLYALLFYLPSQISTVMGTHIGLVVGLLIAIPWGCSMILSPIVTKYIDQKFAWREWAIILLTLSIAAILVALGVSGIALFILLMSISITGFMIATPLVWNLVTLHLAAGRERVIGTAFVGTVGTLGGFVSPILKTWAEHYWNNEYAGIVVLCMIGLCGPVILLTLGSHKRKAEKNAAVKVSATGA